MDRIVGCALVGLVVACGAPATDFEVVDQSPTRDGRWLRGRCGHLYPKSSCLTLDMGNSTPTFVDLGAGGACALEPVENLGEVRSGVAWLGRRMHVCAGDEVVTVDLESGGVARRAVGGCTGIAASGMDIAIINGSSIDILDAFTLTPQRSFSLDVKAKRLMLFGDHVYAVSADGREVQVIPLTVGEPRVIDLGRPLLTRHSVDAIAVTSVGDLAVLDRGQVSIHDRTTGAYLRQIVFGTGWFSGLDCAVVPVESP